MDYRNYAIDLLKRKTQLEAAYESLGYELEMLENEKYSVSSATISPAPVSGTGGNRYENKLVNLIVLIDDARFRRKIVERELKMIEMGFSVLDDYKRDLLEMHYVNSIPSPTVAAMEKYYKERSQIFEDKKKALEAFTRACIRQSYSCNFGRRRRKTSGGASSDAPPVFCGPAGLGTGQGSDAFAGRGGGAGLAAAFFVRQNRPQRFLPQRKGRSRRPLRRGCNAERRALP